MQSPRSTLGRLAPLLLFAGGIVLGIVTDTENWPIDNWLVIEGAYLFTVLIVVGTVEDVRRWRARRDRRA